MASLNSISHQSVLHSQQFALPLIPTYFQSHKFWLWTMTKSASCNIQHHLGSSFPDQRWVSVSPGTPHPSYPAASLTKQLGLPAVLWNGSGAWNRQQQKREPRNIRWKDSKYTFCIFNWLFTWAPWKIRSPSAHDLVKVKRLWHQWNNSKMQQNKVSMELKERQHCTPCCLRVCLRNQILSSRHFLKPFQTISPQSLSLLLRSTKGRVTLEDTGSYTDEIYWTYILILHHQWITNPSPCVLGNNDLWICIKLKSFLKIYKDVILH